MSFCFDCRGHHLRLSSYSASRSVLNFEETLKWAERDLQNTFIQLGKNTYNQVTRVQRTTKYHEVPWVETDVDRLTCRHQLSEEDSSAWLFIERLACRGISSRSGRVISEVWTPQKEDLKSIYWFFWGKFRNFSERFKKKYFFKPTYIFSNNFKDLRSI